MTLQIRVLCLVLLTCCGCRATATRQVVKKAPLPARWQQHFASRATRDSAETDIEDTEVPGDEIQTVSAESPENTTDFVSQPTDLSLANCLALGLSQNPDLTALRQNEHVSVAALGVAETYPFNPYVQVQATPYQETPNGGSGTTYHYVLLMQTIQLAHQQQFREHGAASMLNSTRWTIHQAELQTVAQTQRLYFTTLYLHGLRELAQANHANNEHLLRTLNKQLEAGQATAVDVAIVQVDTRSTNYQLRLAKVSYETALRDLKRQIGLDSDDAATIIGDLKRLNWRSSTPVIVDLGTIPCNVELTDDGQREKFVIASKAASRPDVMSAQADVETARAALCLATASKTPDLQIGPYYQRTADGSSFLGFRAQTDIPVINSGRPLERQRSMELHQRATVWQQSLRRAQLEADAAWQRYKLAKEALTTDAVVEVSTLPSELQRLEEQFRAGEVDVTRVVQARTSMLQHQRAHYDLLNELAQSACNVTATTGIPIECLLE